MIRLETILIIFIIPLTVIYGHRSCNEYVCGSVVSKCLLIKSCQCELTDCFCCKDCFNCLGDLYTECCSCLDLCPQMNDTTMADGHTAPRSQIGDFEGMAEFFHTLTDIDDDRWSTIRYPIRRGGLNQHYDKIQLRSDNIEFDAVKQKTPVIANCTVIFLNTCQTNQKCQQFCESMGASQYRWFHDGCCECIGEECINYGLNESKCRECPIVEDDAIKDSKIKEVEDIGDFDDQDMWDFGEDEHNYNN